MNHHDSTKVCLFFTFFFILQRQRFYFISLFCCVLSLLISFCFGDDLQQKGSTKTTVEDTQKNEEKHHKVRICQEC
jgi:hypothetical protein